MNEELSIAHCMTCNICQTECPVAAALPEFPGPRYLAPLLQRHRLLPRHASFPADRLLSCCTNCKRCDTACPHNVGPARYNLSSRAGIREGMLLRLRNYILAHNVWWGKAGAIFPGLSNSLIASPPAKFFMGLVGIAARDFPRYQRLPYPAGEKTSGKKGLYFPGCYARFNEPEIILSAVKILRTCGYSIEIAPVDCCGIPMLTNSLVSESRRIARRTVAILTRYIDEGYAIITTCSSCGLALKEEYRELVPEEAAAKVAAKVVDLFELLQEEEMPPGGKEKLEKAFYHVPCHLKAQGMGVPAAGLLSRYAVESLKVQDRYCCGIAGTFGFKKEKYELSMKIGSPLFEDISSHKPAAVITDCGTCAIQIRQATGLPVIHPAVALARSLPPEH